MMQKKAMGGKSKLACTGLVQHQQIEQTAESSTGQTLSTTG